MAASKDSHAAKVAATLCEVANPKATFKLNSLYTKMTTNWAKRPLLKREETDFCVSGSESELFRVIVSEADHLMKMRNRTSAGHLYPMFFLYFQDSRVFRPDKENDWLLP